MAKAPQRIMVDTNVALDLLLNREEFVLEALHIFALAEEGSIELLLSTDAISTIFYVVRKNQGITVAREAISKLLDYVTLAGLDDRSVIRGLALDFDDVEDALVAAVAEKESAEFIVTRNATDFKNSPVPALLPKVYLASLMAQRKANRLSGSEM